jgi:hypothetical protein
VPSECGVEREPVEVPPRRLGARGAEGAVNASPTTARLAGATETLLKPLDTAERRQLVDLFTRIADHWYELRAHQP